MKKTPPPLPVPDLEDTCAQFLESIEPITDGDSFCRTQEKVREFIAGEGAALQNELVRYADGLNGGSWLWEYSRGRFLSYRAPLSTVGNFGMEFERPPCLRSRGQLEIAAMLAHGVGKLFREIASGCLPPPPEGGDSLVRSQLSCVLGAARHPRKSKDSYEVFEPFRQAHSFGLFFRNHYYLIRLFDEQGDLIDLELIHAAISRIASQNPPLSNVNFQAAGFAGSEICAAFLGDILSDSHNAAAYQKVCRSIFHISLDEAPRGSRLVSRLMNFGCDGLWLYKPWSFEISADGEIIVNSEHTAIDGISNVYLFERVFSFMTQPVRETFDMVAAAPWESVEFNFSPSQERTLAEILRRCREQTGTSRCEIYSRNDIGWEWFKQRGIGRDALIQTGFAYAQYRLFGAFRSTHESVSMAQYNQGRTSCMRTVTPESAELAERLTGMAVGADSDKLLSLMKAASERHSRNIRRAKQNICFIRHSAGLKDMYERFGAQLGMTNSPLLFDDDNYLRFCAQEISTSTVGGSGIIRSFAFAQMVENGLGLGYLAREDLFRTSITWNEAVLNDGGKFAGYLDDYFDILAEITKIRIV